MKTFKQRLAALEALEAAQQPTVSYVCMHARDFAALDDLTLSAEVRDAIAAAYGLADQKLYVGVCLCWSGESCRVCQDRPYVIQEL